MSTMRLGRGSSEVRPGAHSHDFLVLAYVERGGGSMWLGNREWQIEAGDVYLIAPGEVVERTMMRAASMSPRAGPSSQPEVLGSEVPGAFLSWRAHPLLFPFVRRGRRRPAPQVPPKERPSFSEHLSALDLELRHRQDGYREAVLSHLTLVLVDVSRLAVDVVGDLRLKDEPLLAEVFGFIDDRYDEPISLRDVARAVSLRQATSPRSSGARRDARCRSGSPSGAWPRRVVCWSRATFRLRRLAGGSATGSRATS